MDVCLSLLLWYPFHNHIHNRPLKITWTHNRQEQLIFTIFSWPDQLDKKLPGSNVFSTHHTDADRATKVRLIIFKIFKKIVSLSCVPHISKYNQWCHFNRIYFKMGVEIPSHNSSAPSFTKIKNEWHFNKGWNYIRQYCIISECVCSTYYVAIHFSEEKKTNKKFFILEF